VSEIRNKYELLKQYIEAARETGLEMLGRQLEFERRTIEDLARATQEAPPGPPPKDLIQWLQRLDYDLLLKLSKDPQRLAKYARRFGVDEQTLAERVSLLIRERQWERLANLPSSELKKILMDETLLKKYAAELNISEDALRARLEELLQQRMGVKPPEPTPEKPPIEPIRRPETKPPETQFRPPETEVETRGGQVLIVRAEEELKPAVRRLEELPEAQARLRALLRSRLREESPEVGSVRGETADAQTPKTRQTARPSEEQAPRVRDEQATRAEVAPKAAGAQRTAEGEEVLVLDRNALRTLASALPAQVFTMPATQALAYISRVVGLPVALAPGIPRPSPRESFGAWLDRVFAGTGFTWRSLAAQKETFVFA